MVWLRRVRSEVKLLWSGSGKCVELQNSGQVPNNTTLVVTVQLYKGKENKEGVKENRSL